jgi:hypothetical protein
MADETGGKPWATRLTEDRGWGAKDEANDGARDETRGGSWPARSRARPTANRGRSRTRLTASWRSQYEADGELWPVRRKTRPTAYRGQHGQIDWHRIVASQGQDCWAASAAKDANVGSVVASKAVKDEPNDGSWPAKDKTAGEPAQPSHQK